VIHTIGQDFYIRPDHFKFFYPADVVQVIDFLERRSPVSSIPRLER